MMNIVWKYEEDKSFIYYEDELLNNSSLYEYLNVSIKKCAHPLIDQLIEILNEDEWTIHFLGDEASFQIVEQTILNAEEFQNIIVKHILPEQTEKEEQLTAKEAKLALNIDWINSHIQQGTFQSWKEPEILRDISYFQQHQTSKDRSEELHEQVQELLTKLYDNAENECLKVEQLYESNLKKYQIRQDGAKKTIEAYQHDIEKETRQFQKNKKRDLSQLFEELRELRKSFDETSHLFQFIYFYSWKEAYEAQAELSLPISNLLENQGYTFTEYPPFEKLRDYYFDNHLNMKENVEFDKWGDFIYSVQKVQSEFKKLDEKMSNFLSKVVPYQKIFTYLLESCQFLKSKPKSIENIRYFYQFELQDMIIEPIDYLWDSITDFSKNSARTFAEISYIEHITDENYLGKLEAREQQIIEEQHVFEQNYERQMNQMKNALHILAQEIN